VPLARPARRAIVALSVAAAAATTSLIVSAVAGASPGSHPAAHGTPAVASAPVTGAAAAKAMSAQHIVLPTTPSTPALRTSGGTAYTQSWAGYVTSGPKFRYIQADIIVPTANCHRTSNGWAYEWIGLDGTIRTMGTVEQDGVAVECFHSRAYYAAWYETFPKLPVFSSVAIFPGNRVRATVYYDSRTRKYHFTLVNLANGEGFNTWQRCALSFCRNATAEIITESPCKNSSCTTFVTLADYQTVHYGNIAITDYAGQRGGINSANWTTTKNVMVDLAGQMKTGTSGLSRNSAFYTWWTRSS
jgi:hypothetical protein